MSKHRLTNLIFILIFGLIPSLHGFAQSVITTGPEDSLAAGDKFVFSLKVESREEYDKIIFPDSSMFSAYDEIEYNGKKHFRISARADSALYELQFFGHSDLMLAPLPVIVIAGSDSTVLLSDTVPLLFKSVNTTNTEEFAPLKQLFEFESRFWLLLIEALIFLLIGYLIYIKYFKNRTPEPEEIKPVLPVYEDPLEALEIRLVQLKDKHGRDTDKNFKYFYSELGDALRSYFEQVYNIPALEMTTREIMRHLEAFGVAKELSAPTRAILTEADMVKFANRVPTLDESWRAFDHGMEFLMRAKESDLKRIARKKEEFEASQNPVPAGAAEPVNEEESDDLG